ncbi:hypothetical protein [Cellulomonas wangsupingiae]|uniref:hypothetical protein n=1 Tax=Cellulomonas wangsupingiae TaxID=2968085 RepID=UPI001D0E2462|nr:hypothetical protein [Cellulomonas wangsupingiae]MCC2333036.1 hypothetical protein [Cellulomonas wangsupingiae]
MLRELAASGMTTVMWDVESPDWARPGADVIVRDVVTGCADGSVVLLHDGGGDRAQTVEAVPRILESLLGDGYRVAPLDRFVPSAGRTAAAPRPSR